MLLNIAIYNIHTVYFKTGYYFDYDWQVVHSGSVDNYLTGPMFWDILKNYEDCESDILKSYCTHLKTQLEWYQHVSKINGCYDDKSYIYSGNVLHNTVYYRLYLIMKI